MDKDLKNKTIEELTSVITDLNGKKYQAIDVFKFIHTGFVESIKALTTLSKPIRKSLTDAGYYISTLKTLEKLTDPDDTEKFLFELPDTNSIESVLLHDGERKTVCISSQAGCRLGCKFCATGYLGFKRNLTAAEIVSQVIEITKDAGRISNVVFMGMGEPLDNYDNCLRAIRILAEPRGLNIGIRRQTISTSGLSDGIERLAIEDITPRLAVSLHTADDELRQKIMPIAIKYPLQGLANAMKTYQEITNRRITVEYCMIAGVNDGDHDAKKLIKFLRPIQSNVNLIEYNPHENCEFQGSSKNVIKGFKDKLMQAGIETIIRFRKGRAIKAACGQLGVDRINE